MPLAFSPRAPSATVLGVWLLALLIALAEPAAHAISSEPYQWKSVQIGGGGFVTGLVFHPAEKGLTYARTDVGGAYRWEAREHRWIPLTDGLGMADANLTGIESIALDPADPERVYLAAGTYTNPRVGYGAMLCSTDRGRTFRRVDMPFKMGANELGRGNGERLAVDPHDGRVLFFGSRAAGLWRSADHGASWAQVVTFPEVATAPSASAGSRFRHPVGIVFVAFDPASGRTGEPTPVLYAGVSTRETSLFRSIDAGASWEPVPGQPTGLRPNHMVRGSDGAYYLTYGDEPGPDTMTDGAVWKFTPTDGQWSNITPAPQTPEGFGYGAIAVDARNPAVLMVTTFCRWKPDNDELFRSIDGGRTWTALFAQAQWDHSAAPWTADHGPHWMSDVEINPFDSDHVMVTTGYGIWASRNMTAADAGQPTQWWFQNTNLEETVPLGLISPPAGAHLISALGDLDGFRHDDLTVSPLQFAAPPRFANSESIAYAENAPHVMVRSGTIRRHAGQVRAAYSLDGARTWAAFASEPPAGDGAGTITVSADGRVAVWTPQRAGTYFTSDWGRSWTASEGLPPGLRVVADRRDANRFYAYDAASLRLFVSSDGAVTFTARATSLPEAGAVLRGFGGQASAVMLHAPPPPAGSLYLASRRHGLFRAGTSALEFTRLENIEEAYSLGFGKPAPGRENATLFLAGNIGGVQGIFRSDDDGATWLRINDDAHQFGWINHVTGDPRIFGRVYFATGGRGIIYGDPR